MGGYRGKGKLTDLYRNQGVSHVRGETYKKKITKLKKRACIL